MKKFFLFTFISLSLEAKQIETVFLTEKEIYKVYLKPFGLY